MQQAANGLRGPLIRRRCGIPGAQLSPFPGTVNGLPSVTHDDSRRRGKGETAMATKIGLERTSTRCGSLAPWPRPWPPRWPARSLRVPRSETEEVIVTGSRVSRSGFDSPQPVTAINAEQIENLGLVNVGDIARTMPQNTPFFSETNVGVGNFNVGAQLANLRGLNPFFGTRTLTLVDTRRVVPNSEGSAVDLTLIPSVLVQRVDVVTGGASAAYGSDAIAGVVNVILDKDLEGFKAQLDYSQTTESDGDDMHASFGFGMPFGDGDRGHMLIGGEFQQQDPIGACATFRDWCAESWATHTNPGFARPATASRISSSRRIPSCRPPRRDCSRRTEACSSSSLPTAGIWRRSTPACIPDFSPASAVTAAFRPTPFPTCARTSSAKRCWAT